MAGSYAHVTNNEGQLLNNEDFAQMIENLGDAYEAIEEMYGMIWFLAGELATKPMMGLTVQVAQERWRQGIELSPGVERQ